MQVVVIAGPDKGRVFPLSASKTFSIGRGARSQTRLVDPAVSRIHCELRFEGTKAIVTDAGSASGTFVNQKRVTAHELRSGDVIQVGDTQLRFEQNVDGDTTVMPGGDVVAPPAGRTRAEVAPRNRTRAAPPEVPAIAAVPAKELVFANKPGARFVPKPIKDLQALAGKSLGSYQLLETIGTGQIGVVFKARDAKDQKTLALKVLRSDFALDQKAVQRFIRGMMTVRNLTHPNLIELYNAGLTGSHAWIAMEHVDGASVAQWMTQPGTRRDWRQVLRMVADVARALDFMHQRALIHRAVMPQNILVRASDQVAKLGDAMLAKALEGNASQEVTASGEFVGNIYYMSPERTQPAVEVDGRADIYSLGVTAYALISGRIPFEGKSMAEVLAKIRRTMPPSLRDADPAIPKAADALIARMLAKRPEDRYASGQALLAGLARHVSTDV
jgi:pSer/pThr/pTyr-binding forkhead associated (FHA) protein